MESVLQNMPLAERVRPQSFDDIAGQKHLVGKEGIFRKIIAGKVMPSMILWGPPGVGKTTIARLFAGYFNLPLFTLSAINSGVKEVREVISKAAETNNAILFIDEIHRFSKSQQDSLLGAVENGTIRLIGATTENPSFEVIQPLLSRCQVYVLESLGKDELEDLLRRVCKKDEILAAVNIEFAETDMLLGLSGGDARKLLNLLELVVGSQKTEPIVITNQLVNAVIDKNTAVYDKGGEQHYDIVSAFIKSIRGSDPNAALYWLARMIDGGENPKFIARRMLILAAEDIGVANPNALVLATSCFQAVTMIGYPECDLILAETVVYLATSDKSNSTYLAIRAAMNAARQQGNLAVPLHLRNAPTKLMKQLNYGEGYLYAHDHSGNFAHQEFMPEAISGTAFYQPGSNQREKIVREWLRSRWKEKYGF